MPLILALGRLGQENHDSQASLCNKEVSCIKKKQQYFLTIHILKLIILFFASNLSCMIWATNDLFTTRTKMKSQLNYTEGFYNYCIQINDLDCKVHDKSSIIIWYLGQSFVPPTGTKIMWYIWQMFAI
jgi:hypothetical protein